jgi:DNA primase
VLPSPAQKLSLEERLCKFESARLPLLPYLAERGLGAEAADRFRLGYVEPSDNEPRRYWHRMALPYLTPTGVVQIRYRRLVEDDSPKYLGDPGTEVTLFNAHATLGARGPVFLCEGEMDAIAVTTLTGHPAVGIPGARAWQAHPYWARCFVGLDHLIFPADGDTAGHELADAVHQSLPEVHVVRLPDGEDANSVLARDRAEFLARCGLDR